jgi:hypothetical protein
MRSRKFFSLCENVKRVRAKIAKCANSFSANCVYPLWTQNGLTLLKFLIEAIRCFLLTQVPLNKLLYSSLVHKKHAAYVAEELAYNSQSLQLAGYVICGQLTV